MFKKFLAVFLVVVMVLSLVPMSAFAAATPVVTATVTGKGNDRQVEITVAGEKAVFDYANGSKSGTYIVAGTYEVAIEFSGNSVKSAKVIGVITTEIVTDAGVVVDQAAVSEVEEENDLRIVHVEQSWSKTTFHCNYTSGNGRVWPEIVDANGTVIFNKKNDGKIILEMQEVPGTTKWTLIAVINAATGAKYAPPVCPGKKDFCGCDEWISFSNNSGVPDGKNIQVQHGNHFEILKTWVGGQPDGIEAIFDIYAYNENAADYRGVKILADVLPDTKLSLDPGKYIVAEQQKEGFEIQPDQILVIDSSTRIAPVYFQNVPLAPPEVYGELTIQKTIDGTFAAEWELDGVSILDIADDITFAMFAAELDIDGNPVGTTGDAVALGELSIEGSINFINVPNNLNGWFAVVEYFAPDSLAEELFEDVGPLYVYFTDGEAMTTGSSFDYDAAYRVGNDAAHQFRLGAGELLTNGGDIFPIYVTANGLTFNTLCANAGSLNFGTGDYLKASTDIDPVVKQQMLNALNFIANSYGSVDDWDIDSVYELIAQGLTRPDGEPEVGFYPGWLPHPWGVEEGTRLVSQIVVWNLLNGIPLEPMLNNLMVGAVNGYGWYGEHGIFNKEENVYWDYIDAVNGAIVAAAYDGKVVGPVTDLVLLKCADPAHSGLDCVKSCQPQIVPVYGGITFDNRTTRFYGELNLTKTIDGDLVANWELDGLTIADVIDDISFALYEASTDDSGNPDGIVAFVCDGEMDLNGNITFDFADKLNGWYAVVEFFTPGSVAEEVFEDVGPLYIYFANGEAVTTGGNFDESAQYYALHEWYVPYGSVILETTFADGSKWVWVNGDGNLNASYFIEIRDSLGEDYNSYLSFCASHGSLQFGEAGYPYDVANLSEETKAKLLKALNYIDSTYGSIDQWSEDSGNAYKRPITAENSTYVIAQIVTWMIIHENDANPITGMKAISNNHHVGTGLRYDGTDGRVTNPDDFNAYGPINEAVVNVMANYADQVGGAITKVVYLANIGNDEMRIQPQLVPIYGSLTFDNKTKVQLLGTMQAEFDIGGTRKVIEYDYEPDFFRYKGSITAETDFTASDATWFRYSVVNVAAAKETPFVVNSLRTGNGNNDIINKSFKISIDEDGFVWIDLLDLTVSMHVKLLGADRKMNNNGGHATASGKYNTGLNVGDAAEVYVYIHFESLSYFEGTYTRVKVAENDEFVPYTGAVTLTVKDAAGETLFNVSGTLAELAEYFDILGLFTIPGSYPVGAYTATLSGDGFVLIERQGEIVNNNDVITFDFGSITVTYPDRVVDPGYPA